MMRGEYDHEWRMARLDYENKKGLRELFQLPKRKKTTLTEKVNSVWGDVDLYVVNKDDTDSTLSKRDEGKDETT